MEDKNFTIIEDIFDTEDSDGIQMNNKYKNNTLFLRTLDNESVRLPYPTSNIPSLSYDENMIKNKLSRQINPRSLATQYNTMSNSHRIMQPQTGKLNDTFNHNNNMNNNMNKINNVNHNQNIPINNNTHLQISCRNIYEHIENCPICNKYYKQSNRTYVLIIIFLILIILLLIRQNKN